MYEGNDFLNNEYTEGEGIEEVHDFGYLYQLSEMIHPTVPEAGQEKVGQEKVKESQELLYRDIFDRIIY